MAAVSPAVDPGLVSVIDHRGDEPFGQFGGRERARAVVFRGLGSLPGITPLHGESLLAGQMSADYIRPPPTINLIADELAAAGAVIRRAIEDDRFPHARAPRLDPLRAALAKFDAAPERTALPKARRQPRLTKRARR